MKGHGTLLHFAPETHVGHFVAMNPALTCIPTDYSLDRGKHTILGGVLADIHALPFEEDTFDGVYCLHVLEHVRDDREAIEAIYRVLKPQGQAIIMVPFMMGQTETIEFGAPDPEIYDHVRGYSPLDFHERLSPFSFEEVKPQSFLSSSETAKYKIPESQTIYVCTKSIS